MRRAVDVQMHATSAQQSDHQTLLNRRWTHRWLIIALVGVLSFVISVSHRPDAVFNPQFLAEDGTYFYAQAYNLGGLRALTLPIAGYLVTSARLAGLIATFFPLSWGPVIFNVLAIMIQILPVMFLFTDRFDRLIPNWYARAAIAFLSLAQPNSFELDAAMTYSQWHLAILAFLVVIAAPRSGMKWKVFDGAVLLLMGLSGPFCLMLAPVILLRWLRVRNPFLLRLLAIDVFTIVVQATVLLATISSGRAHGGLGIDGIQLARIIAGQVFLAATIGSRGYSAIVYLGGTSSWWASWWFPVGITLAGVTFLGFTLPRAPQELRLLWLFGALILTASLFSPVSAGPGTYWQRLAHPMWNLRYEYLLILAWLTTLIWVVCACPNPILRRIALALLTATCFFGIYVDWRYPPLANDHYQTYVRQFEQLPAGSSIVIPLNPDGWTMRLIKH